MRLQGKLSDKVGRKPLYIGGTIAILLYAFPYFYLVSLQTDFLLILATVIGLGILWAPVTAVLGTMFTEIFTTNVRYTGVTLGYQLGAALAGGTAPLIATALLSAYSNSFIPVALYIVATSVISLFAIYFAKEKNNEELD